MSRGKPRKPYIRAEWKVSLKARLAGEIDLMLENPLTRKPQYGARARLIEALLDRWLAEQKGDPTDTIAVPSLLELRESSNA
jgi:hypothetical protein